MRKLKYLALKLAGGEPWINTVIGFVLWASILATLGSLFFSPGWFPLALATLVAICFGTLYWRGIVESNHLRYYIGYLLLLDDIRAIHKQSFDDLLRHSDAKDAMALSAMALGAIQQLADRLAAGDPKKPASSSVLGFHGLVWNRKLGRA